MKRFDVVVVVLLLLASGCAGLARAFPPSEEKSAFERALDENKRLKRSLETTEELNRKLAYDLEVARMKLQKANAALIAEDKQPAEIVYALRDFIVEEIRFGMLTGCSDWDGEKGLDGIAVNLLVKDSEGTTLKRKGNALLELVDLSAGNRPLMSWALPAETVGASWRSLPPGFRLRLPWRGEVPWGHDAVLKCVFTDVYGRQFETSVIIRLEREEVRGGEEAGKGEEAQ